MNKYNTVKKNSDFYRAIHSGCFVKNRSYVVYKCENNIDRFRIGISVSKKLGNAVCRNKCKRQLRSIIDKYKKCYQNGVDYIIIIRSTFINLDFKDKEIDFLNLIEKVNKGFKKEIINEEKK